MNHDFGDLSAPSNTSAIPLIGVPLTTTEYDTTKEPSPKRRDSVDWSDLLPEVLQFIIHHITCAWDYVRFRGVCSSWRSAANCPPQLPTLLLPYDLDTTSRSFLDPSDHRVHTLHIPEARGKWLYGTTHGWLVMIGDGTEFPVSLLNPVTRAEIQLPPLPNVITSLPEQDDQHVDYLRVYPTKAILTANPSSATPNGLLALMIRSQFAIYRLGGGEGWKVMDSDVPGPAAACRRLVDFAYFDGAFYFVDLSRAIQVLCATSLKLIYSELSFLTCSLAESNALHLVESAGDLLLLEKTRAFESIILVNKLERSNTNKLNCLRMKWVRIRESIGDMTLFLSFNRSSVSLASLEFMGCGKDLVCLADMDCSSGEDGASTVKVANLRISDIVDGDSSVGRAPYHWQGSRKVYTNGKSLTGLTWIVPCLS